MRFALAALLFAACAPRTTAPKAPADAYGAFLGNYHVSRGPSDPNAPLAKDPDVTEGGGPIAMHVGPAAPDQVVTPTVGEKPDTLEQTKGPVTTPQEPAAVVAPSVALPVNPPGTASTPAPAPGTVTGTTGPVTGAGPNGPGTGTGPATPTGPATGTNAPTPSNPGPTTSTTPPR